MCLYIPIFFYIFCFVLFCFYLRGLNTIVMSADIYPPLKELLENVTLVFKNIKVESNVSVVIFLVFKPYSIFLSPLKKILN